MVLFKNEYWTLNGSREKKKFLDHHLPGQFVYCGLAWDYTAHQVLIFHSLYRLSEFSECPFPLCIWRMGNINVNDLVYWQTVAARQKTKKFLSMDTLGYWDYFAGYGDIFSFSGICSLFNCLLDSVYIFHLRFLLGIHQGSSANRKGKANQIVKLRCPGKPGDFIRRALYAGIYHDDTCWECFALS